MKRWSGQRHKWMAGLALVLALPAVANASAILENFSVTVPKTTLVGGFEDNFAVSPFNEFDPADGTLNSIEVSLNGSGTWTTSSNLLLSSLFVHDTHESLADAPVQFNGAGPTTLVYTVALHGVESFAVDLVRFIGTGTTVLDFDVTGGSGDVFASNGALTGSITYDYTPAAASALPEPASLALSGAALAACWLARRRRPRLPLPA